MSVEDNELKSDVSEQVHPLQELKLASILSIKVSNVKQKLSINRICKVLKCGKIKGNF